MFYAAIRHYLDQGILCELQANPKYKDRLTVLKLLELLKRYPIWRNLETSIRPHFGIQIQYSMDNNNNTEECKGCGAFRNEMFRCSKCTITTYCNQECQRKDFPVHKKYFCREQGKNLSKFPARAYSGPAARSLAQRRQHAQTIYGLVEQQRGQVGLFCYVCGDQEELFKFVGEVACKGCINIQLNMM